MNQKKMTIMDVEKIIYEEVENENKMNVIIISSIATFILLIVLGLIIGAVYRQLKLNEKNHEQEQLEIMRQMNKQTQDFDDEMDS